MPQQKPYISLIIKGLLIPGIVFPFAFLLMLSFAEAWRWPLALPPSLTLRHWAQAFSGSETGKSLIFSLLLGLSVAGISSSLAFVISRSLARHPWRRSLLNLAYLPFALSPLVYASTLYYYFIVLGISGSWLGTGIGHLLITFPYAMILFNSYWNEKHQAMEELVYTLGGSPRQAFWKVLVPASGGIVRLCFFQTFLISWFEYGLTSLLGVGKVKTLTVSVYQYVGEADLYLAAVSCVGIFLPPALLLWLNHKALITNTQI